MSEYHPMIHQLAQHNYGICQECGADFSRFDPMRNAPPAPPLTEHEKDEGFATLLGLAAFFFIMWSSYKNLGIITNSSWIYSALGGYLAYKMLMKFTFITRTLRWLFTLSLFVGMVWLLILMQECSKVT